MNYISTKGTTTAHWRIRQGAMDRDTSLAVPVILAAELKNKGFDVDFEVPWGRGHSGDYDLERMFIVRRIISIVLAISFVVVSVTGIHMDVKPKPQNVISNPGADKSLVKPDMPFYPKKAHEWSGYIFIMSGLVHIVLNKRAMLAYVGLRKNSTKNKV